MPAVNVNGLAASRKTPGVYLSVILGGPGTSAGDAPMKLLLMGRMITADIVNTAPSYTITAGTHKIASDPNITAVQVVNNDDGAEKFGRGSELHLMIVAAFAQWPDALLYAIPIANPAGAVRASTTLTFTAGTATSSGTLRFVIKGVTLDVAVASGDTAAHVRSDSRQHRPTLGDSIVRDDYEHDRHDHA
jgi:phage tail sheath gpL-like